MSDNPIDAFFGAGSTEASVLRSGFIAVAGRPNAGKSTLVNRIVGHHVAIVSPVAQTTRRIVRAVARRDDAQLVFVDLPGSQKPMDRMTARMQEAVERSFRDVDVVLWVIDAQEPIGSGEKIVRDLVFGAKLPVVIGLNKVDLSNPVEIAERISEVVRLLAGRDYHALVPISATTGDGVDPLLDELAGLLPEGPAWFGDDDVVDMRDEERIAEYVREATLAHLREELPHASAVTVDELFHDPDDGNRLHAECTIWVERESQVGIVVGKGGEQIRDIGVAARGMIETQLGTKLHLSLRVKVRKHWRDDATWLARAGL
ncbi:MAG: GTP-binding protein Era [Thermoleophilia bacterium]|nr:GTP-binding protein Era [Thermoleophilia bacterium]